jgi:hypothetical protein
MLHEVYNLGLYVSLHLQITMNQWKTGRWMKTSMLMCVRRLKKINHGHLNVHRHK